MKAVSQLPQGGYRPEIDGLRALAVAAVFMYHLELGIPGGFVGVDVFFVISGFLITGIIRRGLEKETFSLANFWERRIRRIFPALFVVLVATLAAGYWLLIPTELVDLGKSSVAQILLLANVFYWKNAGYFQAPAAFKPLLHMWSLAVEEQFYLFFPLALVFLKRLGSKKLFALFAIGALLSFSASVYGANFHHNFTFYLLPTRAWELLIGCMLAILPRGYGSSLYRDSAFATTGMLAIIIPMLLYDSQTTFPGLAAAPPVLGTAAIIFATTNTPNIWLCKILSLRPVVFIGLISYSLYLWHWPVIVYTKMYFGYFSWKAILVASVVSLCCAALSWKFVEMPLRTNNYIKQRRHLFLYTFALTSAAITVSILFISEQGMSWRFSNYPSIIAGDMNSPNGKIDTNPDAKHLDFLIFGDSHGIALSETINAIVRDFSLSGAGSFEPGSIPLPNASLVIGKPRQKNMLSLINNKNPAHVVLIAKWNYYMNLANLEVKQGSAQKLIGTNNGLTTSESGSNIICDDLNFLADYCSQRRITLWVVKQVPRTGEKYPAREWLRYSLGLITTPSNEQKTLSDHNYLAEDIESVWRALPAGSVRFIDPAPLLFDDEYRTVNYLGGRSVYRDDNHLSKWGAERIRPVLEKMFREILKRPRS